MKLTISEILKELNNPGLLYWANGIGLKGESLKDFYNKSTKKGIDGHSELEDEIKEKGFKDYHTIEIEKNLDGQFFYGRCDFIAKKLDDIYIFDFKSNDKIYLSHILQLLAYKHLYNMKAKIGIINLETKQEKIIDLGEEENQYWEIFKGLYLVCKNKKLCKDYT